MAAYIVIIAPAIAQRQKKVEISVPISVTICTTPADSPAVAPAPAEPDDERAPEVSTTS